MPNIPDFVYKFHRRGGHEISYIIINQETGATSYYQYMSTDGYWYVMKSVRVGDEVAFTYTAPVDTDEDDGWTARAGLDYVAPNDAFG